MPKDARGPRKLLHTCFHVSERPMTLNPTCFTVPVGAPGCPRMPKDAPGGFQSSQEASSYVFSRVGETHDAESYVFYRAGEAPGGSFIRAGEAPCWRGPRRPQGGDP